MNTKIREMIESGRVDGFFAYRELNGTMFPVLIDRDNLNQLQTWKPFDTRYPITKLLLAQHRANPDKTYGVLARGCEERSLGVFFAWNQIPRDRVVVLGQACSKELAAHCECWKPFPDQLDYGEPAAAVEKSKRLEDLDAMDAEQRLNWWLGHFNRCIKCYGCRDVCPVCFCTECSLEHQELIQGGMLPPDTSFHLVRAVHMGGRCIDCGLCEELCPSRIPLRALYKEVNRLVEELYDYKPGTGDQRGPFTILGDELLLPQGPR